MIRRLDYSSSSSLLYLKVAWVVSFSRHLMPNLSIKFDKICTQTMAWHLTIPQYGPFWSIDAITAVAPPQNG